MLVDKASKSAGRVLLPDYVKPTKYDLKLTPDLKQFTFDGIVSVELTTSASASEHKTITLHAKELLFKSAKFQFGDKSVDAEEVRESGPRISSKSFAVLSFNRCPFFCGFADSCQL